MGRHDHTFQFSARDIYIKAGYRAVYHAERLDYWKKEYDKAVSVVEETISAKVVKYPVTDGYTVEVVVNYGDKEAYSRMQQAFRKIQEHTKAKEAFESDAQLYKSQSADRAYELNVDDVRYYKLADENNTVEEDEV